MFRFLSGRVNHSGPVWQVAWVAMPSQTVGDGDSKKPREQLLSVGEDGLVIQWHFSKGQKFLKGTGKPWVFFTIPCMN